LLLKLFFKKIKR